MLVIIFKAMRRKTTDNLLLHTLKPRCKLILCRENIGQNFPVKEFGLNRFLVIIQKKKKNQMIL